MSISTGTGTFIRPSRGDRKPCTIASCRGTTQFGRRNRSVGGGVTTASNLIADEEGWSCTLERDHFVTTAEFAGSPGI